jgi:hypothetical protein
VTTIAYRDGVMASDSLITTETGLRFGECVKIGRAPDGTLAGASGPMRAMTLVLGWLQAGAEGNPPEIDGVDGLVVRPDGSMFSWDGTGLNAFHGKYAAVGSGGRIAFAAMAAGADAVRAVEIAIELDTSSGGKTKVLTHAGQD